MSMSDLPSEILRFIMREATYMPLETEWTYTPEVALWDGWVSEINPSSTTAFRRNLALVCKKWRDVAIEFLYECLSLFPQNGDPQEAITSQLDALSAVFEGSTSPGYGWWTRRIEISSLAIRPASIPSFERLLNAVHDIHTLVISGPPSVRGAASSRVNEILNTRFHHSLRRYSYPIGDPQIQPLDRDVPILAIPLRTVTLHLNPKMPFSLRSSALSLVTSLALVGSAAPPITEHPTPELPILEHLSFIDTDSQLLPPFISRHKASLTSLHISLSTVHSSAVFSAVLSNLPLLQSLVFNSWHWVREFSATIPALPKLSHIGISGRLPGDDSLLTSALQTLGELSTSKTLKCIQVGRGVDSDEHLLEFATILMQHGIKLEESILG